MTGDFFLVCDEGVCVQTADDLLLPEKIFSQNYLLTFSEVSRVVTSERHETHLLTHQLTR